MEKRFEQLLLCLGKEAYEQLQEAWIVEMAELSAVKRAETEIEISKYLAQIFAAAKAQPEFAQHIHFLHLCQAVSSYENRIESYKRKYNSAVRDFNTLAEVIPLNILVKILEFEKFEYFDFEKSL